MGTIVTQGDVRIGIALYTSFGWTMNVRVAGGRGRVVQDKGPFGRRTMAAAGVSGS